MDIKEFKWYTTSEKLPNNGDIVLIQPKVFGSLGNPYFGMYDVCKLRINSENNMSWESITDADMTEYETESILHWSYIPEA